MSSPISAHASSAACFDRVRTRQVVACSDRVRTRQPAACSDPVRTRQVAACSDRVRTRQPAACSDPVRTRQVAACSDRVRTRQPAACSDPVRIWGSNHVRMREFWNAAPVVMELSETGGRAGKVKRYSVPGLPWDRFSAWLECVCVVTFDLELGQAIELVYPHDVRLTEKEKTSICYLSFPDSYSGCLGDTQFSFRIRQTAGHKLSMNGDEEKYNRDAPVVLQRDRAHYYGFVYFRQVKDSTVKRGYFQKSLVLISRLPFVNLFHSLLQLVAPEYFEKLEPCLEAVCNEIDQWPAPVPGNMLSLPVMGVVIQV
ncbi:protein DENND6B-like [Mustelus asterias]